MVGLIDKRSGECREQDVYLAARHNFGRIHTVVSPTWTVRFGSGE